MKSFQAQTHYEVLEISVSASTAEVRSAYERLTRLYGDDQVVLYGMVDGAHATALRERLREAFDVLADDTRRDAYDVTLGLPPRDLPPRPPARPSTPGGQGASPGWGAFSWVSAPTPSAPPAGLAYVVPTPSAPAALSIPLPSAPPVARVEPAVSPAPVVAPEAPAPLPVPAPAAATEEPEAAPPTPAPEPPLEVAPTPAPVAAEPGAAEPPPEPEVPRLADDAEVSIVPLRTTSKEFRIEARPRPYEVPPGVEFNGDLLRQVRMARGLSLTQLWERTRIGVKHLENVEGDRYDALPAAVYLRGILMNIARELGLDGLRVSKSYLSFVDAHRSKG